MRHAVERLDRVTGNGKPLPRKAADLTAMLLAVRDELDAITLFNGHHAPLSYEEAFRLSEDELARRFATTQDPTQ
jgi:hypothetical protein